MWHPLHTLATIALTALVAAALARCAVSADTPAADPRASEGLVAELASPRFDVRQHAAADLRARPDFFSSELPWRLLASPQLPMETRWRLHALASEALLTRPTPGNPLEVAPLGGLPPSARRARPLPEIVAWLESAESARQAAARDQLQSLFRHAAASSTRGALPALLADLKQRLADPKLSPPAHRALDHVYQQARLALVNAEPGDWELPSIDSEQVDAWLDDWLRPAASRESHVRRQAAERELYDVLLRDENVAIVAARLRRRLEQGVPHEASPRAEELLEWTQPCLVAESWLDGELKSLQYLIVGQPQRPEGAPQITLFDRANERTAHCVSGNSLLPGDYPVGQAIQHPEIGSVFFHLLYLPTPRRRAQYNQTHGEWTNHQRLRHIAANTIRRWQEDRLNPSEDQVVMLFDELEGVEQGALLGDYLAAVDDKAGDGFSLYGFPYKASCHARICFRLARYGKRSAVPGLVRAIENGRFLPPRADGNPYHYGWIAALAIAVRDPWKGVDEWLAGLIDREDRLFVPLGDSGGDSRGETPTLGATAAAILAERNGWTIADLGLIRIELDHLNNAGCPGHRFASPEARAAVLAIFQPPKAP